MKYAELTTTRYLVAQDGSSGSLDNRLFFPFEVEAHNRSNVKKYPLLFENRSIWFSEYLCMCSIEEMFVCSSGS